MFCTRCGRILTYAEYKKYVCLCIECVGMIDEEIEDDMNNIDNILEERRDNKID